MTDSYLKIYLNSSLSQADPTAIFSLLFLFLARMLPIIGQSPFFGARVLPNPVKVTFAISLFVIFLPQLMASTTTKLTFSMMTLLFLVKELFIGFILGFVISVPFQIVQSAGMFIDHQRGGASLMVNDPTIQNQSSPLGTLFNLVLIYIFFLIDGPFLFIDAIGKSYEIVPPDSFINPHFFDRGSPIWDMQIKLLNSAMKIAVQMATPALLAILMTDVFLGIANRLATQVQITFLGLPLKSLLGLGVLFLGWKALTEEMVHQSYIWLKAIELVNYTLKPLAAGT